MSKIDPITGFVIGCQSCKYLHEFRLTCKAFPRGIPLPIQAGEVDHQEPFEGDNGIQYEPIAEPRK